MNESSYETVLRLALLLSQEDQLRLARRLQARSLPETPSHRSILELRGLGKEIWEGIDAQEYVNYERGSWGE